MKKSIYNRDYIKENYFGEPYPVFQQFFRNYEPKGTVLDIGCGQGRNALFLGRLGYNVEGIDISVVGIEQLNKVSDTENLPVHGMLADQYTFQITDNFDIILLDSILHFYKNDAEKEKKLVSNIIRDLKPGGIFCNMMLSGKKREEILKSILADTGVNFELLKDTYGSYPEHRSKVHMLIIRKI
jgi:SAM-dependent methyltransferase